MAEKVASKRDVAKPKRPIAIADRVFRLFTAFFALTETQLGLSRTNAPLIVLSQLAVAFSFVIESDKVESMIRWCVSLFGIK